MSHLYDVAIAGGGPAGAACATLCAQAGLRTLVLEKSNFPRDKVCGDCLNPGCWPLFEQLGVAREVLASPHHPIDRITFVSPDNRRVDLPFPSAAPGEIAVSRRILDDILLRRSERAGAEVHQGAPLRSLSRDPAGVWRIEAGPHSFNACRLVAADGRNSTVARLLGVAPPARRDRVGLQAHIPTADAHGIELHIQPDGYCGVATVGDGITNFCLVAHPSHLDSLKATVSSRFALPSFQQWRAISPLERAPLSPLCDSVLYVGDAARIVEPFTGEGVYYALHTGILAARHIIAGSLHLYPADHAALYRRRLWINHLARTAVTHPGFGTALLRLMTAHPAVLRYLINRVTSTPSLIPSAI